MKISEARYKANRRYNEKTYETINTTVKKGERERIKKYAESKEMSVNSLICKSLAYCIENNIDVKSAKDIGEVI